MKDKSFLRKTGVFHGRSAPEEGILVGYGAVIEAFALSVPLPTRLVLISAKKRLYNNEQWQVFPSSYKPEDTLYKQLVFALKYEGVNLLVFKELFKKLTKKEIIEILAQEPLGQYSRKIWFLFEW